MKTNLNKSLSRKNLQKAVLRSAAVVISFVLISFTVAAQGFWEQLLTNNGISEIAMVLVDQRTDAVISEQECSETEANTSYNYYEVINENQHELENWMLNESYFESFFSHEMITAEMPTQLEGWMLDEAYFSSETENEKPLVLESWMTDNNHWEL